MKNDECRMKKPMIGRQRESHRFPQPDASCINPKLCSSQGNEAHYEFHMPRLLPTPRFTRRFRVSADVRRPAHQPKTMQKSPFSGWNRPEPSAKFSVRKDGLLLPIIGRFFTRASACQSMALKVQQTRTSAE